MQNNRSKTSAFGVVSGREIFVKFSHLYSSGTSLKEFLGYCKYTANPDGKKTLEARKNYQLGDWTTFA